MPNVVFCPFFGNCFWFWGSVATPPPPPPWALNFGKVTGALGQQLKKRVFRSRLSGGEMTKNLGSNCENKTNFGILSAQSRAYELSHFLRSVFKRVKISQNLAKKGDHLVKNGKKLCIIKKKKKKKPGHCIG